MVSFGCLSISFPSPWADFGVPLGSPCTTWVAMKVALGCPGAYISLLAKIGGAIRGNGSRVRWLHTKKSLLIGYINGSMPIGRRFPLWALSIARPAPHLACRLPSRLPAQSPDCALEGTLPYGRWAFCIQRYLAVRESARQVRQTYVHKRAYLFG